jgi:hypothetical protein
VGVGRGIFFGSGKSFDALGEIEFLGEEWEVWGVRVSWEFLGLGYRVWMLISMFLISLSRIYTFWLQTYRFWSTRDCSFCSTENIFFLCVIVSFW